MITLFSALLGLIGAAFPDVLQLWRDQQDRQHELKILDMQLKQQAQGHSERLSEIQAQADIGERQALYKTWYNNNPWVDALNGSVRPVLAYAFFLLYAVVKCWQFVVLPDVPMPWQVQELWQEEDQAIFAGIISFYYGQRAMGKLRAAK